MTFIHSLFQVIVMQVAVMLSSLGLVTLPAPVATSTPAVASSTPEVLIEAAGTTVYAPVVNGVQTTKEQWAPVLEAIRKEEQAVVPVQPAEPVAVTPTVTPALTPTLPVETAPAPQLPPVVIFQVETPPAEVPSVTSQPIPTPMPTYEIVPPADARPNVLDLLGNRTKSLEDMRAFVMTLAPQIAFKKRMQSASAAEITEFLQTNGYQVTEIP